MTEALKEKKMAKIVRSKIPQIIESLGRTPDVSMESKHTATAKQLLREKISEEAKELVEAKSVDDIAEEAGDLIQAVLDYVNVATGLNEHEIFSVVRMSKNLKRGTFVNETGMITILK